jgi:hypothetical protein
LVEEYTKKPHYAPQKIGRFTQILAAAIREANGIESARGLA